MRAGITQKNDKSHLFTELQTDRATKQRTEAFLQKNEDIHVFLSFTGSVDCRMVII